MWRKVMMFSSTRVVRLVFIALGVGIVSLLVDRSVVASVNVSNVALLAESSDLGEGAEQRYRRRLPKLKKTADGELVPDIPASAVIVYSPKTGRVLWEDNSREQRSIASITKVMTVLVFLEEDQDLSQEITVQRSEVRRASVTYLRSRERVTLDHVLHLALIASDNVAARVLARVSSLGTERFIQRMNEKARELGLEATKFSDPSGLDAGNLSSAYDLSRLIVFAASDERIGKIMRKSTYRLRTNRRRVNIRNTNKLLQNGLRKDVYGGPWGIGEKVEVRAAKTGYIREAGFCLAILLRLPSGEDIAIVLLGARSNVSRFRETQRLVNWVVGTMEGARSSTP